MNKIESCNGQVVVFSNSVILKMLWKLLKINSKKDIDFVFERKRHTKDTILKQGFNLKRLKYNFDCNCAFFRIFLKKNYKKVGFLTPHICSVDYDIYLRTIYKLKIKGDATNKNELIGIVNRAFRRSFMKHLIEEAKIRVNNNQNIFCKLNFFQCTN